MSALGYKTTQETLVGWRCWRVLPFQRLDGSRTFRLCAVGTRGTPKLWEPRQAMVAACSAYDSNHEAPWPDHECGVWAVKRSENAHRRMVAWMQTQGGDPVGWATGQVSLWGRVIEHEGGWRAQYAYPYAITLEGGDETLARTLRREYAIDVTWAGTELYEKALAKRAKREETRRITDEQARAELDQIRSELKDLTKRLETPAPRYRAPKPTWRHLPYLRNDDVYVDGLKKALAESKDGAVRARDVAEVVAEGDPKLPLLPSAANGAGAELHNLAVAGRVVQLRRGGAATGASLWTLPGQKLSKRLDGWAPSRGKYADFDEEILTGFIKAIEANDPPIMARHVAAYLNGGGPADLGLTVRVSHGLGRLALGGRLTQHETRPIETWSPLGTGA